MPNPQTDAYTIRVSGAAMCAAAYTPPLSWGSLSLILTAVGLVLYIAGGVAYNVKIGERRATVDEAFPHWAYWKQLPGLVKDGCAFSWEEAQKAYYSTQGKAPPLDQSLTRRLAEAQEDGGRGDARALAQVELATPKLVVLENWRKFAEQLNLRWK